MELIQAVSGVFVFIRDFFDCFPFAVKSLVYLSFLGVVYIAVMKGFGR